MSTLMSRPGRPTRRSVLGLAFASMALFASGASTARAQSTPQAAIQQVNDLYTALLFAMRSGGSFQQRFDRLAPVIDRVFDLNTILQVSVGLRWSTLDEASRRALFTVFRAFTVASYTANFDKDSGEKFEVVPQTRGSGADLIVQSKLIASNGEPIRIDYVMRASPTMWRVVDVLLDGSISRVAVQRSDFRALLASGDPGQLIASLRKKVAELSGGTIQPS
jgi:phospholipid transport system substrate-binding protein